MTAAIKARSAEARKREWKKNLFCWSMLIVAFYGIIRYLIINLESILLAFSVTDVQGDQVLSMVNFEMLFQELANSESVIYMSMMNTFKYFFVQIATILVCFVISYFLYKKVWGYKLFRVLFFLPSMISPVIMVLIFKDIIKVDGLVYHFLQDVFDYTMPNLVANFDTATPTILFYCFWLGLGGGNMLLFVGALNRIPEEVFEAGKLDGCNTAQEFFHLVLPLAWETLSTLLFLSVMSIFMSGGPIMYFTGGAYGTNTLSYWIFDQTRNGSYNYPTAVGLFFTLVGLPIVIGSRLIMNRVSKNAEY